ncbi:MAG: hypothetical protein K2H43_03065 [Clostridia bacterium]|nr:hypothetical protein [Clostridia bacterium]
MKKKIPAAVSLLLSIGLLCACGGTTAEAFGANWNTNTANRDIVSGKTEHLEYAVTFQPAENTSPLSLNYTPGTYTADLSTETRQLPDSDKTETVYRYTTRLDITGNYTLSGETGETFTDSVVSTVYFRSVANGLQPLESTKHVVSTSPTGRTTSLKDAYVTYDYTYTVKYTNPLSKANVTFKQTLPEASEWDRTVSLGSSVNYFDNEQLEFILRGLDMTAATSLKTLNPLNSQTTTVRITETPKDVLETLSFQMDGEAINEQIATKSFSFGYASDTGGQAIALVYAKKTGSVNNRFRNVMLRREVTVMQDLGKLVYTLTRADFIH